MFGRRRRASSNPPLTTRTADPSAATAAISAFRNRQPDNVSLSSAAASAALRSRPTTPISVADVQTKRTMRRSGSTSSMGSSVASSHPGLERRGSNSSMSSRTFRDPSPGRGSRPAEPVPPVPALPRDINTMRSSGQVKTARRAASLDVVNRASSPSFGPRPSHERRGSVNFSYPTSNRPMSSLEQRRLTSPSPSLTDREPAAATPQKLIYDPNTRTMIPAVQLLAVEHQVREAAAKPVKKKKKKKQALPGAGSHLAEGTAGDRPRGTAVDAIMAANANPAATTERSETPPSGAATTKATHEQQAKVPTASDSGSEPVTSVDNRGSVPPAQAVRSREKSPAKTDDESQGEQPRDDTLIMIDRQIALKKLDPGIRNSPSPSSQQTGHAVPAIGHGRPVSEATGTVHPQEQPAFASRQPPAAIPSRNTVTPDPVSRPFDPSPSSKVAPRRVQSLSPSRGTHFAAVPETLGGSLSVRHSPPARSISPRKSALKHHSPSPRDPSPSDTGNSHESQEASPSVDDRSMSRKKSVRVSFDDENVVVLGTADPPASHDAPIFESPQVKRSWLGGLGKSKKAEKLDLTEKDETEVMTPRPLLPSFGSVREKRHKEPEDRPLVRPTNVVHADPPSQISQSQTFEPGASADHAIGLAIAEDIASKARPVAKSNEPLPPQVTSRDGTDNWSDSESDTQSVTEDADHDATASIKSIPADVKADRYQPAASKSPPLSPLLETEPDEVPEIAVTQPTPTLDDTETRGEWMVIPGGFPSAGSDVSSDGTADHTSRNAPNTVPSPSTPETKVVPVDVHTPIAVIPETDSSDGDSIYSDAAEDFTDNEGGFMSLNAVVESPVRTVAPKLSVDVPALESPSSQRTVSTQETKLPTPTEGWDEAQQYWRSLTLEQKAELERAAAEKAQREALEKEAAAAARQKKNKPLKSALKQSSVTTPPSNNNRTYMVTPGSRGSVDTSPLNNSHTLRSLPAKQERSMKNGGSLRGSGDSGKFVSPRSTVAKAQKPQGDKIVIDPSEVDQLVKKLSARSNKPVNTSLASAASATAATGTVRSSSHAPRLMRRGSGDSDSSFKRARPASQGPTMRRSMREPVNVPHAASSRSYSPDQSPMNKRFSLRSLSPGRSPTRPPSFNMGRGTMRGSRPNDAPTLRPAASEANKGGVKLPGFGRSKPQPKPKKSVTRFSSRFGDSSDEEDVRPSFRSRFDDSSDDEDSVMPIAMPVPTRPVTAPLRRIPTDVEDGESSDLPDSSDDEATPVANGQGVHINGASTTNGVVAHDASSQKSGSLHRSGSGRGTIAPAPAPATIGASTPGAFSPARKQRRGSFLGSILGRKKDDPNSKIRKAEIESPARRDTPLERKQSDLRAIKRTDSSTSGVGHSPKLQKRPPPASINTSNQPQDSENWPLPASPILSKNDGRPSTSHAADTGANGQAQRLSMGERRASAPVTNGTYSAAVPNGYVAHDEKKKKKKFHALRKMFKLDE